MTFEDTAASASDLLVQRRIEAVRVVKGKSLLMKAIEEMNVGNLKLALWFLSSTKLAVEVPKTTVVLRTTTPKYYNDDLEEEEYDEKNRNTGTAETADNLMESFEINVTDFSSLTSANSLSAAIGPYQVHTELVRCLLEPQRLKPPLTSEGVSDSEPILASTNARLLLEVPCNGRKIPGMTPLAKACHCGNLDLAKLLLEHGANPNVCGNDGLTPLIRMAKKGDLKMIRLLLLPREIDEEDEEERSGNYDDTHYRNTSNNLDCTPATGSLSCPFAADSRSWPSVYHKRLRLKQGQEEAASPDTKGPNANALNLKWGTDVYRYDQQAMNALIHACTEDHLEVAAFLVETVGNHSSNHCCRQSIIDYVNDYKVDPALWYSSAHGNADIVRFLVDDCSANPDYRKDPTEYSSTPLMEACEWGHVQTVNLLLERTGSDPRSRTGRKARQLASRAGYIEVVERMDTWTNRLNQLEDWSERGWERVLFCEGSTATNTMVPAAKIVHGLLPRVLNKAARRHDLIFRILVNHLDDVLCYNNSSEKRRA